MRHFPMHRVWFAAVPSLLSNRSKNQSEILRIAHLSVDGCIAMASALAPRFVMVFQSSKMHQKATDGEC